MRDETHVRKDPQLEEAPTDSLTSIVIALVAGVAVGLKLMVVQVIDESVHIGENLWRPHQ